MAERTQVVTGDEAAGERTRRGVGRIATRAQRIVARRIEAEKGSLAKDVDGVALAVRQTGANLRERERNDLAPFADDAAEQIEKVSGYVRQTSTAQMLREAEEATRRRPALVLSGAFALAFATVRFLRSTGSTAAPGTGRGHTVVPVEPGAQVVGWIEREAVRAAATNGESARGGRNGQ